MSGFLSSLTVTQVGDIWELASPLVYQSDLTGKTYFVPAGFKTDFMSVPRLPIIFEWLGARGNAAGALHDWLYTAPHAEPDRETADKILRESFLALADEKTLDAEIAAEAIYQAVRIGGAPHWE